MKSPFRFFDKIYVISAKDNIERRDYMQQVVEKLAIGVEFLDAVMGENLSEEEISAVYDEKKAINHKTHKRPLSKAEIGCAISHINVYKKILDEGLSNALIFEDDIIPDYKKLDVINKAVNELPENWDTLYLGTLDHFQTAPLSYRLKLLFYYPFKKLIRPESLDYTYRQLWNLYPRNYSKNVKRAGFHRGNHAYAMSRRGAKKFLSYHDSQITTPVDNMVSVMIVENKLNAFITKEKIFAQNKDFESAIEKSRLSIRQRIGNQEL